MAELLLEVGCEELPAFAVRKAAQDLADAVTRELKQADLLSQSIAAHVYSTPRRLILGLDGVLERQADRTKRQRGPSLKAAYDAAGQPAPALIGFCRSQEISTESLEQDGDYVWAQKLVVGEAAIEVLTDLLPRSIRSLGFDKTMRWGSSRMRFARPIRWLLASLDGEPIPFEMEGVHAGLQSRGHRFYSPDAFEARRLAELLQELRARFVEPDPEIRMHRIMDQAKAVAEGIPDLPSQLVEENTFLTEWPTAIAGEYRQEFQDLPEPVLVTAMAKHERMFPVRDKAGSVTNQFVFIRNSGEDASVRQGASWVLNARFNDARFFYDLDQRSTMAEFLEQTQNMVFQEKLGSIRQRADRLSWLTAEIAKQTGSTAEEIRFAKDAGLYAKADLSTGLVSELSSLQGIVGGQYGRREGWPGPICWAIETQYNLSKNPDPANCEGERTAIRLTIADQMDKLAGYLGLGLEPTGSSDPYGLRRAVTLLIEAAWVWPKALPAFDHFLESALSGYREQGFELNEQAAQKSMSEIFAGRYSSLMSNVRYDILEAALLKEVSGEVTRPQSIKFRSEALEILASDPSFVQTATRPLNLIASADKKGIPYEIESPLQKVDVSALDSKEGTLLLGVLQDAVQNLRTAVHERQPKALASTLQTFQLPINEFFDTTMIMTEQVETRTARLTLLHACAQQLLLAGDFTKIVVD
jgi:glycyl-tRNA synthetase beta chain